MSTKPTAAANADLDERYGAGSAGGFYAAALTAVADGEAGSVTEATGGAYARQAISFAAAAARRKENSAEILFPQASTDHGNIVAWGIYDAVTVGNLVHVIDVNPAIVYNTGYQPRIAAGDLAIEEAAYTGA